jgi:hypothetical protein
LLALAEQRRVDVSLRRQVLQLDVRDLSGLALGPAERGEQPQGEADDDEVQKGTAKQPTELRIAFREGILLSYRPSARPERSRKGNTGL